MSQTPITQARISAWLIDLLLMIGLSLLVHGLGWLLGTGYWLLRDGLFEGQSVGKRLLGLRVVTGKALARCTYLDSVIRNLLWVIPLVNLVMALTGLHALTHDPAGRHWGDRLADTRVVHAKDA